MKKIAGILIILTTLVVLPSVMFILLGAPWYAWIACVAAGVGLFLVVGVFYKITLYAVDLILGDE